MLVRLLLLLSFNIYAQSGCIFQGNDVLCMKPNLKFQASNNRFMTGQTINPSVTATPGIPGDLFINATTGDYYIKKDSGTTTNWEMVAAGTGTGDVQGPASSVLNALAQYADTSGKILKGTAWTVPNAIGAVSQYLTVVGGQDTAWTSLPGSMVQVGGAPVTQFNLPMFGGTAGTQIIDTGIAAANVVTQVAASVAANHVKLSGGANKILIDSAYTVPATSCTLDQILKSDGTNFICAADSGGTGDVVGPASSVLNTIPTYADTTGKLIGNGAATYLDFINNQANPAYLEGRMFYDQDSNAVSYMPDVNGPVMNMGQELWVEVRNNSGATINNGQVVRLTGAIGQFPTIALAQANNPANANAIGVATHNIANNTNGYITFFGVVRDINTSAFADGDVVYLSDTVAGGLTATPPNIAVRVGRVFFSHVTQGKLGVFVTAEQSNAHKVASPAAITAAGAIALTNTNGLQLVRITSAADVTMAAVPFTGTFVDGTEISLLNVGTFTITVPYNTANGGVISFGSANISPNGILTLIYSLADLNWYEKSRSF